MVVFAGVEEPLAFAREGRFVVCLLWLVVGECAKALIVDCWRAAAALLTSAQDSGKTKIILEVQMQHQMTAAAATKTHYIALRRNTTALQKTHTRRRRARRLIARFSRTKAFAFYFALGKGYFTTSRQTWTNPQTQESSRGGACYSFVWRPNSRAGLPLPSDPHSHSHCHRDCHRDCH